MLFRTLVVACLLVLGISLPDFSSILDLIGATTITVLNFIFPPIFYMFLADQAKKNKDWVQRCHLINIIISILLSIHNNFYAGYKTNLWSPRSVPMWMRVYSWHMVIVGVGGGILSFVNAVMSVKDKLQEGESCWTVWIDSDSG